MIGKKRFLELIKIWKRISSRTTTLPKHLKTFRQQILRDCWNFKKNTHRMTHKKFPREDWFDKNKLKKRNLIKLVVRFVQHESVIRPYQSIGPLILKWQLRLRNQGSRRLHPQTVPIKQPQNLIIQTPKIRSPTDNFIDWKENPEMFSLNENFVLLLKKDIELTEVI